MIGALGRNRLATNVAAMGGGGATPIALRIASMRNDLSIANNTGLTSALVKRISRTRDAIGDQPVAALQAVFTGYYCGGSGDVNVGNAQNVRFAVEYNGVVVEATFGGVAGGVIPNGAAEYICDPIPATAFGVPEFPAGATYWKRDEREVSVGQASPNTGANTSAITGEGSMTAAAGAASQLLNTGALVADGTWTSAVFRWMPQAMIGYHAGDAWVIVGDSLDNGVSDAYGDGTGLATASGGGGWAYRAGRLTSGKKLPMLKLAEPGSQATAFIAATKRQALLKYVTLASVGYGRNDFVAGGVSVATMLSRLSTVRGIIRANPGVRYLMQRLLFPQTTASSDSYQTVAGQTVRAGWETGGAIRDAFNSQVAALVGTDGLDAILDLNPAIADATFPDKWKANGSGGYATGDGTHLSQQISGQAATLAAARFAEVAP